MLGLFDGCILSVGENVPTIGARDGDSLGVPLGILDEGEILGESDGASEGSDVGFPLGLSDGKVLGLLLGLSVPVVGNSVGNSLGLSVPVVGNSVGNSLGLSVLIVGNSVGNSVGEALGLLLGLYDGFMLRVGEKVPSIGPQDGESEGVPLGM